MVQKRARYVTDRLLSNRGCQTGVMDAACVEIDELEAGGLRCYCTTELCNNMTSANLQLSAPRMESSASMPSKIVPGSLLAAILMIFVRSVTFL